MLRDDSEANWNRRTDGQDHVLSQADTLTKNVVAKDIALYMCPPGFTTWIHQDPSSIMWFTLNPSLGSTWIHHIGFIRTHNWDPPVSSLHHWDPPGFTTGIHLDTPMGLTRFSTGIQQDPRLRAPTLIKQVYPQ